MNLKRTGARLAAAVLLGVGAVAATAAPAAADYGPGNVYQIEISSNDTGPVGGGIWLWLALSPSPGSTTSGTGDYTGSDCGHGFGSAGAVPDAGDVTWSISAGTLVITGVKLNGFGGLPVTITVPSAYGHYSTDILSVFPTLAGPPLFLPPGEGFSQVQVAP
jgi:hypothetical protein